MRRKKTIVIVMIAMLLFVTGCGTSKDEIALAAENENSTGQKQETSMCAIGTAEKYVAKQLKLTISGSGYAAYRDALVKAEILLPTELQDTAKSITKGELALLASRVMLYKGEEEDTELSALIKEDKRISDLSKIDEPYKSAAIHVFGEGVMVGSSNGKCSQNRKFKASSTMTAGAMKSVMLKALGKKDRSIMSPDGQLTRTTNLPKNYKKYSYILASFPNSYYEMINKHERTTYYYTPEELHDYAYPKDMSKVEYYTGRETFTFPEMFEKYGEEWLQKIENNLTYRLNFDYRTVDNKWVTELASSYHIRYGQTKNEEQIADIKDYVKTAKKNKVVIKADKIVIEPSSIYKQGGEFFVRCYLRFKVNADEIYSADSHRQSEMIYCDHGDDFVWLKYLKKGQWYEGYYDIGIGGTAFGDSGYGFSVTYDILMDMIYD